MMLTGLYLLVFPDNTTVVSTIECLLIKNCDNIINPCNINVDIVDDMLLENRHV